MPARGTLPRDTSGQMHKIESHNHGCREHPNPTASSLTDISAAWAAALSTGASGVNPVETVRCSGPCRRYFAGPRSRSGYLGGRRENEKGLVGSQSAAAGDGMIELDFPHWPLGNSKYSVHLNEQNRVPGGSLH